MKILISAGPTREAIDPVRFITNHSSGKMGYALAQAAVKRGWQVVLVSGPVDLPRPEGLAEFVQVVSAAEMADAVKSRFPAMDGAILCAAVADYRPVTVSNKKIKKSDDDLILQGKGQQVDVKQLEQQWQARQDQAVQDVKIQYAALEKLRAANVIDAELVWNAGIIDKSKLSLDAAGNVTGIDDVITQLQKDKAHLFGKQQGGVPGGTGKDGGDPFVGVTTKAEFLKLSADQQFAFKQANPTLFKQFLQK